MPPDSTMDVLWVSIWTLGMVNSVSISIDNRWASRVALPPSKIDSCFRLSVPQPPGLAFVCFAPAVVRLRFSIWSAVVCESLSRRTSMCWTRWMLGCHPVWSNNCETRTTGFWKRSHLHRLRQPVGVRLLLTPRPALDRPTSSICHSNADG